MIEAPMDLKSHILAAVQRQSAERGESHQSAAELEDVVEQLHAHIFHDPALRGPDDFPVLSNLSAAFMYEALPIPDHPGPPEFLYVPSALRSDNAEGRVYPLGIAEWNMAWESARLRAEAFQERLPSQLKGLSSHQFVNVYLLPRGKHHRYDALAPLYHLLPLGLLERNGLPVLHGGFWPHLMEDSWRDLALNESFDEQLGRAFAQLIWGQVGSGSGYAAFAEDEPIRLLAHNLDFWLPYAYEVIESRLREFPRVAAESGEEIKPQKFDPSAGVRMERPRMGGYVWLGEEEVAAARSELFAAADGSGRLRGILDAVRSNRVEEDFSDRWSFAREDLERKLYRKRSRVSVKFVELDDTIPVHGPDSEVHEDLAWGDVIGLFDGREREVVVLLRSGFTKVGDIATEMGYANHSPVSKALARIRRRVEHYLE